MAERCTADFGEVTLDCELDAGHQGDHEATLTWAQSDPSPVSLAKISPGYAAFLKNLYAAARHG